MSEHPIKRLILDACDALEVFNIHAGEIEELRAAGVREHRIKALYPFDAEDYREAITERLTQLPSGEAFQRSRTSYPMHTAFFNMMPPQLQVQVSKPLPAINFWGQAEVAENTLADIRCLHNIRLWFDWDYVRSLPERESMNASRLLKEFKDSAPKVGYRVNLLMQLLGLDSKSA